jgi:Putative zinc-finger
MNHATDQLSDYLDDELPAAERGTVEAHLVACAECSEALAELRRVMVRARELEDLPPVADLWPGIEARLRPRRAGVGSWLSGLVRGEGRRVSLTLPQLAAAAAAVMVATAGILWMTRAHVPAPVGAPPSTESQRSTLAVFDDARYDATVAELEQVLKQHRADLDTSTVRILEQNLKAIDRAAEQARRALLADPGNPYLHGHLADQMRRKIWLLQRATEVVTAQS